MLEQGSQNLQNGPDSTLLKGGMPCAIDIRDDDKPRNNNCAISINNVYVRARIYFQAIDCRSNAVCLYLQLLVSKQLITG